MIMHKTIVCHSLFQLKPVQGISLLTRDFHPRETSGMTREKLCYLVRRRVDLTSHEGKTKLN